MADTDRAALEYHRQGRPGKIAVVPTKPVGTQWDLSLAYTPGVAEPCRRIHENAEDAFKYTARGNLVGVVSNGTAVLGLGDLGALASKPVMEGKGVLFKKFAGIDVFDIEVDATEIEHFVSVVAALEPTFGGINLEDIKAPECFEIEQRLRERMKIPVLHDDQHGTAIIVAAAVRNALALTGKDIGSVKLVTSGAGAAALACVGLLVEIGLPRENVILTDVDGVVRKGRKPALGPHLAAYAQDTKMRTLGEVIDGADIFLGLSVGGVLKPDMVKRMAKDPLVLALANPVPEILPDEAMAARADAIVATGRSDYPNQVNNVL
jgi:malate dehydrogenase (oxaloacetate-decarboxylating)(NADP+)